MGLKTFVRDRLPTPVVEAYDQLQQSRLQNRNRTRTTEQVFTAIYANNEWGGSRGTFHSGECSRNEQIIAPYIQGMQEQFRAIDAAKAVVVDLGCGDFQVGARIAGACRRYIGVDIVAPLIEYNQRKHGNKLISFQHANIIEDELPPGDVCLVRRVFQYLSNDQILKVLPKLARYRYAFITEHHPSDSKRTSFNLDKPHGGDVRVTRGSGVFLEHAPFNIPADRYRLVFETPRPGGRHPGVMRTYRLQADRATAAAQSWGTATPDSRGIPTPAQGSATATAESSVTA